MDRSGRQRFLRASFTQGCVRVDACQRRWSRVMKLRRLTPAGIERFRSQRGTLRQDPTATVNETILEDATLTELVSPTVELERPGFGIKREAADYLDT